MEPCLQGKRFMPLESKLGTTSSTGHDLSVSHLPNEALSVDVMMIQCFRGVCLINFIKPTYIILTVNI